MSTTNEYPELEKMNAVQEKGQAIGEFLEWLASGEAHEDRLGDCPVTLQHRTIRTRWDNDLDDRETMEDQTDVETLVLCANEIQTAAFTYSTERLLAKFFGIDLDKAEQEKLAIFEDIRNPAKAQSA